MIFNVKDSGKLIVHFCYLDLQPSFLDFVQVQIQQQAKKAGGCAS